jgi:hypothetical protein
MGKPLRLCIGAVAGLGVALLAHNTVAQTLVTFQTPHAVRASTATIDPAVCGPLDTQAKAASIAAPDDLVAFALRITASALHFGLAHRTRLSFDGTEREGNCIEYAELFASIVNREHGVIDAHAWVVRSAAVLFGKALPDPAWKDHDWVLVVLRTPAGVERRYVDPTL